MSAARQTPWCSSPQMPYHWLRTSWPSRRRRFALAIPYGFAQLIPQLSLCMQDGLHGHGHNLWHLQMKVAKGQAQECGGCG